MLEVLWEDISGKFILIEDNKADAVMCPLNNMTIMIILQL